ncbi:MAG: c-type cytochrome [Sphingobium sp.]
MTIRITVKRLVLALLALGIGGLLFAWSGLFQVAASSGHWAVTDWLLHWTMRNSVRTHAALGKPIDPPADVLDGKGLISAAGHYRQACQICHGAPGVRPSAVMQRATPPAPDLAKLGDKWTGRQLGWIIEHGVKMTGMPAWGAEGRRDEVARMTAFVQHLPGMTAEDYDALTEEVPPTDIPGVRPGVLAACTGCHGADGRGRGQADIPILGGQSPAYLRQTMADFASGRRSSAVMQVAVAALSSEEMDRLARHFASMPGLNVAGAVTHPLLEKGAPSRQLPACAGCHAPGKPNPAIFGQKPAYIAARLRHWHGDDTVVDALKPSDTMATIARRVPANAIDELAHAIAGK